MKNGGSFASVNLYKNKEVTRAIGKTK